MGDVCALCGHDVSRLLIYYVSFKKIIIILDFLKK